MIREAKNAGAGLAKFQLFNAEADRDKPWYKWVKAHELTFAQALELFRYGREIGIEVFFSCFGIEYVKWCEAIGVKRYKVASTYQRNPTELDAVIRTGKPIIISSPTGSPPNITPQQLYGLFDATWLFCSQGYPSNNFNLPDFDDFAGLSDHTIGIDMVKIAIARGASIIEKHFCLEHNPDYPDNDWSMTPDELRELVRWEKVCREGI